MHSKRFKKKKIHRENFSLIIILFRHFYVEIAYGRGGSKIEISGYLGMVALGGGMDPLVMSQLIVLDPFEHIFTTSTRPITPHWYIRVLACVHSVCT